MYSQRHERPERKPFVISFRKTDQCRVMMMSDPGQSALERRGNVGETQVQYDQTEPTRSQQLFSRTSNRVGLGHANNRQCRKVDTELSRIRRIERTFC